MVGAWLATGAADLRQFMGMEGTLKWLVGRLHKLMRLRMAIDSDEIKSALVGSSPVWRAALERLAEASFAGGNVLILGESGTGKELAARMIHHLDKQRRREPFITLDCSTVKQELSGSEFFGHERGAFTGATGTRAGAFELAHGGTLFLDEVGELSGSMQAQLLRVVQEGSFKRLGSNEWRKADFRLVCATHRRIDLEKDAGSFRLDFYHRISRWICRLPTLAERRTDIPELVESFIRDHLADRKDAPPQIDPAVLSYLEKRDYPGNVRELRHLSQVLAAAAAGSDVITIGCLPRWELDRMRDTVMHAPQHGWDEIIREGLASGIGLSGLENRVAQDAIRIASELSGEDRTKSAKLLGVCVRTIQGRLAAAKRREEHAKSAPNGRLDRSSSHRLH